MQNGCMALAPQSLVTFTWKEPPAKPSILQRAEDLQQGSVDQNGKPDQPYLPWKAYLATRDFQNLASDITNAFFAKAYEAAVPAQRPQVLMATAPAASSPVSSLLAPILQTDEAPALHQAGASDPSSSLPLAA